MSSSKMAVGVKVKGAENSQRGPGCQTKINVAMKINVAIKINIATIHKMAKVEVGKSRIR